MSATTPDAVDVAVGRNIRIQRMSKGLSQTDLAVRLGISFQQVQKYEKGINRVGAGRLIRIAKILEVPLMALFVEAKDARPSIPLSPLRLIADPMPLRLAQAFSAIDDAEIRRSLVALVEKAAGPRPRGRRKRS
jgi:transcriptional regulator with XRE-family HTH domain